jgi:hypothetical protein
VSQRTAPQEFFKWEARHTFLPFATAGQKPQFLNPSNTLVAIGRYDFAPAKVVYLPPETERSVTVTNEVHAQIHSSRYAAQQIQLDVESDAPALVVISQAYYSPWRAYVDGKRVPLWRANYAFQALEVPGGRRHVELRYMDWNFYGGLILCAIAVLICVWIWKKAPRV